MHRSLSWKDRARVVLAGWREADDPFLIFAEGKGARVRDTKGREFIDLGAQSYNLNLGHFPQLHDSRTAFGFVSQKQGVAPEAIELAERLLALAGESYSAVHFTTSGGLGIEAALKIARQVTRRTQVLALRLGYHGATAATQALAGWKELRRYLGAAVKDLTLGEPAYCYHCPWEMAPESCDIHCATVLADTIRAHANDFAAVVAEPILTNQAIVPPQDFWKPVLRACNETGTLLIFDEVVTGLGRTGTWWAQNHYGVKADILVAAKGLNAGLAPLGATLASQAIADRLRQEGPFLNGQTDEGHPLCCRMGLAVLDCLEEQELPRRAGELGALLGKRLPEVASRHPVVADIRGRGLLWGLELDRKMVPDKSLPQRLLLLRQRALEEGLLLASWGRVVLVTPPLVISEEDLFEGLERLNRALAILS